MKAQSTTCLIAAICSFAAASGNPGTADARPKSSKTQKTIVWAVGDADSGVESATLFRMIRSQRVDSLLYLGDVYESGTWQEYRSYFKPLLGSLAAASAPTIGNHEWANRASGYQSFWRAALGSVPPPYYSFRLSGWQLLSLNSEDSHTSNGPQARWLLRRLAKTKRLRNCRIAYWHRPRFSAGPHGDAPDLMPIWKPLQGRARLVLSGHDHSAQRFHPAQGLAQIVAGAGGRDFTPLRRDSRLAFARAGEPMALRLALRPGWLRWSFHTASGRAVDRGVKRCSRSA